MSNDKNDFETRASNATSSQLYELSQDVGTNPSTNPTLGDIIADRFSRRDIVKGALGIAAIAATTGAAALDQARDSQ